MSSKPIIPMDTSRTSRTPWQEFWRHFKRNRPAVVGSIIVLALTIMAVCGWLWTSEWFPGFIDPNKSNLKVSLTAPFTENHDSWYLFGTDENGRSIWLRLLAGSVTSLSVGFVVVGISVVLGILVGGIAGFYGRGKARFPFLLCVLAPPLGFLVDLFDFMGGTEHTLAWLCFGSAIAALALQVGVAIAGRKWSALAWFGGFGLLALLAFGYPAWRQYQGPYGESFALHEAALEQKSAIAKDMLGYVAITKEIDELNARINAVEKAASPENAGLDKIKGWLQRREELQAQGKPAQLAYEHGVAHYGVLSARANLADARSAIFLKYPDADLNDSKIAAGDGVEEEDKTSFTNARDALKAAESAQAKALQKKLADSEVMSNEAVRTAKQRVQQRGGHGTSMNNALENVDAADWLFRFSRKVPVMVIVALAFVLSFLVLTKAAQEESANRPAIRRFFFPMMTIDNVVMRVIEIMGTVPRLFLLLTILAFYEKSALLVMFVLGVTSWMGTARFVRAEMLSLRERDFVSASRALGMSDFRVVVRHMVPNSMSPVLVSATIGVAQAIIFESTLSFLGIGVGPDEVTWGKMLNEGRQFITTHPWLTMVPGLAIFVVVLAFNLLGEGLREAMNPKLRKR